MQIASMTIENDKAVLKLNSSSHHHSTLEAFCSGISAGRGF